MIFNRFPNQIGFHLAVSEPLLHSPQRSNSILEEVFQEELAQETCIFSIEGMLGQ